MDYTNTFAQEYIKEQVFVEPPRGIFFKDGMYKVLKPINSLYGIKQAPQILFEKLRNVLLKRGFVQSEMDKFLFMKSYIICLLYVYDTIISVPNAKAIK